jgi:hypothetical protein
MSQAAMLPAFVILLAAAILGLVLTWKLFALIKAKEPEAYASLREPHLLWNNTPLHGLKFVRFLFSRRYLSLHDDAVRKLGGFLYAYSWVYLVCFVFLVVVMLVSLRAGI